LLDLSQTSCQKLTFDPTPTSNLTNWENLSHIALLSMRQGSKVKNLLRASIQACYHRPQFDFHVQPADVLDHYETEL
jgi:hypothetical protein